MAQVPGCGYGDENFTDGGYGDNNFGYGSPCSVIALVIVGDRIFHDIGGELVVVTGGAFSDDPITVKVNSVEAYSGIAGQGNVIFANTLLDTISFVCPNLFGVTGPVNIEIINSLGTQIAIGLIEIVRQVPRTSTLLAKLRFPRGPAGPYFLPIARPRSL